MVKSAGFQNQLSEIFSSRIQKPIMTNAKKYNNIKLVAGIAKGIVSFILILLFVKLNYSQMLEDILRGYFSNDYLVLIGFVIAAGLFSSILFFPLKYYLEYYLEHKYNLSNQTIYRWLWEDFKGLLVGGVIGIPILLLFYFVLLTFKEMWWLVFAVAMFFISVLLAKILPIFILPIFYKISPIDNDDLRLRIIDLCTLVGMKVENVFAFNMSKNTKKANAAFTGLGKTKRIILGDTLLNEYSHEEIETVIAHELGHFKKKHIIKNIAIGTVSSFLTFYLIATLYSNSINWFGFESIIIIAALPILSLWAMIIGLITTPISNIISRKYEYEADQFAIEITNNADAFINTLNKLTEQNLGDKEPHPVIEWFFYSHPSIKNRISHLEDQL